MYVMMNRITVPEDDRPHFEKLFKTRARAVDKMPGFIRAQMLRPQKGSTYVIMTHWESEQSFLDWTRSDEFELGHKRAENFKDGDGKMRLTSSMEVYEVFAE